MPRRPQVVGRRGRQVREPYDRVLIVTEGEKTEPLYFRELIKAYRINTANVHVTSSTSGSDPISVVQAATRIRDAETHHGEQFDKVYCVFDRNSHRNFDAASELAGREDIRLARSWPCFEYWLLLHYEFVRAPFARTQANSPCDKCISMLRKHVGTYRKASPGMFERLSGRLEGAKSSARRALADAEATLEPNPSTELHILVEYLQRLKLGDR